jgi:hypothetical protein
MFTEIWNEPTVSICYRDYSCILRMEIECSSETSVEIYKITWHQTPENFILHSHKSKKIKRYINGIGNKFMYGLMIAK